MTLFSMDKKCPGLLTIRLQHATFVAGPLIADDVRASTVRGNHTTSQVVIAAVRGSARAAIEALTTPDGRTRARFFRLRKHPVALRVSRAGGLVQSLARALHRNTSRHRFTSGRTGLKPGNVIAAGAVVGFAVRVGEHALVLGEPKASPARRAVRDGISRAKAPQIARSSTTAVDRFAAGGGAALCFLKATAIDAGVRRGLSGVRIGHADIACAHI